MDSCVCAALAARDHDAAAVHISYGQRTEERERRAVTYVPFRNAHFLSVAVSWAEVLGAGQIYIGAVEQDSSGYPDCRPAYYQAFNQVVKLGTKEEKIEIVTPLIQLRKNEIVRLGLAHGIGEHEFLEFFCGVCDSCVLRLRAFREAGSADPIPYAVLAERV